MNIVVKETAKSLLFSSDRTPSKHLLLRVLPPVRFTVQFHVGLELRIGNHSQVFLLVPPNVGKEVQMTRQTERDIVLSYEDR